MAHTSTQSTVASLAFRALAFSLAAGFWLHYVGSRSFDASGGWRYLTNWGLTLNLLVASWALAGCALRPLRGRNPLLPAALTVSSTVVILYWSLYLISPSLVNGNGGLPWFSELYMHLGTTLFVYAEAIWLNPAPANNKSALGPVACVGVAYIAWVELVVSAVNDSPCGLHTPVCGYPYPFLNDFSALTRGTFYALACVGFLGLSTVILRLWKRLGYQEGP